MKKIIINYSIWDDSDYIITIRPEKENLSMSVPIGGCLNKADAKKISNWLKSNIEYIQKIIIQIEQDKNI